MVYFLNVIFRPIEFVRELFKSTPNLNKDRRAPNYSLLSHYYHGTYTGPAAIAQQGGHIRSTSYSVSYGRGKPTIGSPTSDIRGLLDREV